MRLNAETKNGLRTKAREHIIALLAEDGLKTPDLRKPSEGLVERDEETAYDLSERTWSAQLKLLSTRDELSGLMFRVKRDFESAEQFIRGEAASFNNLGILQSTGPAIDRLAGMFSLLVDVAIDAEYQLLVAEHLVDHEEIIDHA